MEQCILDTKEVTFDRGIFDEIVDCTYVLLCCGPKPHREASVHKNIDILRPTSTVKMIYNSGCKDCPLSQSAMDDMASAQIYIFNDALKNNYKRILFLEDDFLVPKQIEKTDIDSIITFIKEKSPSLYGLGNAMIPTPMTILQSHQQPMFNFIPMAHAVIYSKHYMNTVIEYYKNYPQPKIPHDILPQYLTNIERYRYYKPLVYQTFPITDNQKNGWAKIIPSKFLLSMAMASIKMLQLDKHIQPGYTIIYVVPYVIYVIALFIILFIIYKLFNRKKSTI